MKEFRTSCKDSKTGYEMILSECSYNMAMNYLADRLSEVGYEIRNIAITKDGIKVITTNSIKVGVIGRTFYYDEGRGYLLGE